MYNRYKYSRGKKPEESILDKNVLNTEPTSSYRKSAKTELFSKNNNVITPTTQEIVNRSKYRTTKTTQPIGSKTARNTREIKTNENNNQSQQVPPRFKTRSYIVAPTNNNTEDKLKDYKSSLNEKKNNNENKNENENNNPKKRYFRRFNKDKDKDKENNENKNDEKKVENTEESATSNSNLNTSSKNTFRYTTGRLVNDSNEDLIKMDKKANEIEVTENAPPIKGNNNPINNPINEKGKRRFGTRYNKTDDNLPQKDIISKKDEFKLENVNMKNKRSSIATSFVPGSRNNPIKLYNSDLFSEIAEVPENNESSNENNSKISTRKKNRDNNKFISSLDSNEIIDKINKNEESDINNKNQNLSKENELNEENNGKEKIKKDNIIEEENDLEDNYNNNIDNNVNNYENNNDNNVNNYDNNNDNNVNNYDDNKEEINNEQNNIKDKDKDYDNDNDNEENKINNNNMLKKNIKNQKMNDNEHIIMDNIFNEVEQFNAKTILKGDLAEIYDDLIKQNVDFKDEIFFINLNHFEKKVGDCDDRLIMHSFKNFPKEGLFQKKYLSSQELIKKYYDKAERIKKENEF